ncbi:hypothetical protein [Azospirillum sp. BE72]|uniref:hypothetical protein n=1 Tax=Azospirillum sp. BE72 TaxID=2817776 RepID=UPI00285C21D5|nr:hypothetical protein [Azospirillum sp. BE72]MDR6772141.1 hypothetical protein [Azospirillum sp. BE72]
MRAKSQVTALLGKIYNRVLVVRKESETDPKKISELLDLLVQYKHFALFAQLFDNSPMTVKSGIFEGLLYDPPIFEGSLFPRLLGTYEANLQPHIVGLGDRGYGVVLNIGCAEGYYAAGLGRMFPDAVVHAYEIQAHLREACAVIAADNGLASRIRLGAEFVPGQSEVPVEKKVLLFCDIEGGEFTLLNLDSFPQLADLDMVVEVHPSGDRSLDGFMSRFHATHDVEIVDLSRRVVAAPRIIRGIGDFNQLLSICEFRGSETPWVILRSKTLGGGQRTIS